MNGKRWVATTLATLSVAGMVARGPARAEWRASAGIGVSYTHRSDLRVRQGTSDFTVDGVRWKGRAFQMPPWYNLQVTYFTPRQPALGFTIGLLHMKVYADTNETRRITGTVNGTPIDEPAWMHQYIQKFNISHGVNFISAGVTYRWRLQRDDRFPNGRLEPYVSLMAGPVINHPENTVLNVDRSESYETNNSWGTVATLGVHYAVSRRWGLYTEVKRSHVSNTVELGGDGSAHTNLNTTHISTGVNYSF